MSRPHVLMVKVAPNMHLVSVESAVVVGRERRIRNLNEEGADFSALLWMVGWHEFDPSLCK